MANPMKGRKGELIGESVVKWDALDKACGRFRFPSDLSLDGILHLKVLRAGHLHARILRIDTEKARAIAGVVCVLTYIAIFWDLSNVSANGTV